MPRRALALILALLLSAAACGEDGGLINIGEGRDRFETGDGSAGGRDGDGKASGGDGGSRAGGGSGRAGGQDGVTREDERASTIKSNLKKSGPGSAEPGYPGRHAPDGAVFLPEQIRYVYFVGGRRKLPGETYMRAYHENSALYMRMIEKKPEGDNAVTYTYDAALDVDRTSHRTRTKWDPDGIHLIYERMLYPGGLRRDCRTEPFPTLLPVKVKVGSYPAQRWSGEDCSGTTQAEVVEFGKAKDAQGRIWRTWKIETDVTYRMQSAEGTIRTVRWFTPDIGVDIRVERTESGTVDDKPYRYEQTFLLATP